jgi:Flp pilus assembly protein TadG
VEGTRVALPDRTQPRPWGRGGDERGSTIPFVLGCFLLAMVLVAGAVAAGDAFVQQSDLQSVCDAAAIAAVDAADLAGTRAGDDAHSDSLPAGTAADVQQAVDAYLARDPQRAAVRIQAATTSAPVGIRLDCTIRQPVTFGAMFGLGAGVTHRASSSARAPLH